MSAIQNADQSKMNRHNFFLIRFPVNAILFLASLIVPAAWPEILLVHGNGSLSAQEIQVGDRVEFERFGKKLVGVVKEERAGGRIFSVEFQNGPRKDRLTLPASRITRLGGSTPPPKAGGDGSTPPPKAGDDGSPPTQAPGSKTGPAGSMRLWTDKSGKFKIRAKFTERVDNLIRLEKEDGRLITVPIEKLSEFDQKYLENARPTEEEKKEENPSDGPDMKKPGTGTSGTNESENGSSVPMNTVTPDLSAGRKLILISSGQWNVQPDPEITADASPQPVEHGPGGFEKPFFDKFGNFVTSPNEEIAAVSITNAFGGDRTGIQFFDLQAGKQLSSVGIPVKEASLAGVVMNPPTFATRRKEWFKDKGRIDFWDGSDGLKHVIGWEGNYKSAKLLNDEQLLTIDQKGQAVVWDWRSAKALFTFTAQPHALPALSANGKQMAVAVNTGIMIIELASGKPLGTLATRKRVTLMAFSRNGSRLATIQNGNLAIWDLVAGKLIDEFAISGISPFNPSMNWADDEHILINGTVLVNYRLRVPVWTYRAVHGSMRLSAGRNGRFWYSVKGKEGRGTLIPLKLPQQEVLDVVSNYDPEDFLVIQPGMKVAIRMDLPFPQGDQQKIYDSIANKLEENGCIVDPDSPTVLKCFTEKGKTQSRDYENRPGFGRPFRGGGKEKVTFTPTISYMQMAKGTDVLWKKAVSSGPGFMMFLEEGQTAQQAANKQSKPSPQFFIAAQLPKYFARLPQGKKALGESELTENGLR